MISGLLLVDKPAGWTSFDAVKKIRGTLSHHYDISWKRIKVGHAGTLDPFATGLLILAIGKATKQLEQLTELKKVYTTTIKLGVSTPTLDIEGEEIPISDAVPSREDVEHAISSQVGNIAQVPPDFSAKKINGKRAYDLARVGKALNLKPKNITIYKNQLLDYTYPHLQLRLEVSKGTYIRAIARDIGENLGIGGYCTELRRLGIGEFKAEDAFEPTVNFEEIKSNLIILN